MASREEAYAFVDFLYLLFLQVFKFWVLQGNSTSIIICCMHDMLYLLFLEVLGIARQ